MPDKKAFLLRIDPGVWVAVEQLAQAELRSVNAQMEFLLRDALTRHSPSAKAPGAMRGAAAGAHRRQKT